MTLRETLLLLHIEGLRLGAGFALDVHARLLVLQDDLLMLLRQTGGIQTRRPRWVALAYLLPTLTAMIAETYAALHVRMLDRSLALATRQASRMVDAVNALDDSPMLVPIQDEDALRTVLATTPFPSAAQGNQPSATAADWWTRQGERVTQGVTDQLHTGTVAGEDLPALERRIEGTPAQQGKDGLMAKAFRSAEAVAMAQAAMAVTQGVEALARDNAGKMTRLRHDSILDNRTTEQCMQRDGKLYDALTLEPIGHALPYLSGVPYHIG